MDERRNEPRLAFFPAAEGPPCKKCGKIRPKGGRDLCHKCHHNAKGAKGRKDRPFCQKCGLIRPKHGNPLCSVCRPRERYRRIDRPTCVKCHKSRPSLGRQLCSGCRRRKPAKDPLGLAGYSTELW